MLNSEIIRFGLFLGILLLMIGLESLLPRKKRTQPRRNRWLTNICFSLLNTLTLNVMAIALPLLAVGAAHDAQQKNWGILHQIESPVWLEFLIALLIMDLVIWGQHLLSHKIPILWKLHRVHHADRDVDVTTAIRFHPIEIALSMILKIGAVYALGPGFWAVVIFEIILNGTAMFNHANVRLPLWLDKILRLIIVTPDMHRVHHSINRQEHDSNYGFALSIWDRMFRTYIEKPRDGHDNMKLGLQWQNEKPAQFSWSLMLPFKRK